MPAFVSKAATNPAPRSHYPRRDTCLLSHAEKSGDFTTAAAAATLQRISCQRQLRR
jgi:hypothetical protein